MRWTCLPQNQVNNIQFLKKILLNQWYASLYQFRPEVKLIVRVRAINHSYEALTLSWLILKYAGMNLSVYFHAIIYNCFFIHSVKLFFSPSLADSA